MPANTNTGYLLNPTTVISPDLAVQQQQVQRQQDLIDALRGQSLQPIDGGRGAISWTQGAAKLADALAARVMQKRNDKQSVAMSQAMASRLGPMFGMPAAAGTPQATALATALKGGDPASAAGPIMVNPTAVGGSQVPASAPLSPPVAPPAPDASPATSPPPVSPQAGGSYPMSLSGNPQQDFMNYAMSPEEFMKARIAASAPADFTKLLQQSGIDPNSPIGRQLMQSQVAKQNYIAPISGRPGSTIRDPNDPSRVLGYDAPNIEGAFPVYGPNGMPTGYQQAPGATQAFAAAEGAKTAGKAANTPITAFDAQGNPVFTNELDAAHGGQGGALRPQAPLGAVAAANVVGTNSANAFQQISDSAADVPNRLLALRQMDQLVSDPKTLLGPGSDAANRFKGVLATFAPGVAPPQSVTNGAEFNKWAAQYSARTAQELGLSGSDSRLALAVHATPNGEMTAPALKAIIPQMVGFENAKAGMARAAQTWQQTYGPQSVQAFRNAWNQNYDPRVYTWMAQGPKAFAQNVAGLSKPEAARLRQKYLTLKQIGALPQ